MRHLTGLAATAILLAAAAAICASPSAAATERDEGIAPQSLAAALNMFARQSGLKLIYASDLAAGKHSDGAPAGLSPTETLQRILAGTGLVARWLNDRTVSIGLQGEEAPAYHGTTYQEARGAPPTAAQTPSGPAIPRDNSQNQALGKEPQLEEIVVTAQKRTERLIDTPQSVTVLSSQDLARLGASQFRDFANTVPGLSFTTSGAGFTQISLRGVTEGQDVAPTVGIYVDDVPYGSSSSFNQGAHHALDVGLFDMDRIEVLRGPQGTLYGASTIGGLIKYVTRSPDATAFSGEVQTGVSTTKDGGVSYNFSGVVNVPIIADKVALRASAYESHDGGYIDNVALNQSNVNRSDIYGGRFDLLIAPTEALNIRLGAFLQDISRYGQATADYTLASVPAFGGSAGAPIYGSLDQYRKFAEPFEQQFKLVSGTVRYDLGPAAITSISAYQTTQSHEDIDVSAGYVPLLPFPYSAIGTSLSLPTHKFTQELRVSSQGATTLEWLAGGFYTHESSENDSGFLLRDLAGQPAPNILGTNLEPSLYTEYAGFADLTWNLTNRFDVSGGARYAHDHQQFQQIGSGLLIGSVPVRTSNENVITYLANARYHFGEHVTGYLRYATGYRPGGPNELINDPITSRPVGPPTFGADHLKSYEGGVKAESADRRFGLDLSGYYIDWSNIQILVTEGAFSGLANAPNAHIQGSELTLTARPFGGFTATGAFAYQHAYLSQTSAELGGAEGERLPNVPRFSATLNADYEIQQQSFRPSIGGTLRYVSDRTAGFDGSFTAPQYRLPSYTTLDLRGGFMFGLVQVQLYVHNIFDNRGQLSALTLYSVGSGPAQVAILQPRTVGIALSTRF